MPDASPLATLIAAAFGGVGAQLVGHMMTKGREREGRRAEEEVRRRQRIETVQRQTLTDLLNESGNMARAAIRRSLDLQKYQPILDDVRLRKPGAIAPADYFESTVELLDAQIRAATRAAVVVDGKTKMLAQRLSNLAGAARLIPIGDPKYKDASEAMHNAFFALTDHIGVLVQDLEKAI